MHTEPLLFITGNTKKLAWLKRYLDYPVEHMKLDLPEIQSLNLEEIVTLKAKEAFKQVNRPVLVEDTSLAFQALGKLPGPFIKWFFEELGNEGICDLLDNYPTRSATATVLFGHFDGKTVSLFSGESQGTIADHPRGEHALGWDPIYIPHGYKNTWGEMSFEEQKATSMRQIALEKLEKFLRSVNKRTI